MSKLKVYGWQGWRREAPGWHHQTREICAARSRAEVGRIVDRKPSALFNLEETGNDEELKVALAQPGVVFWRGLDEWGVPFQQEPQK
jgi:hypothetical protein